MPDSQPSTLLSNNPPLSLNKGGLFCQKAWFLFLLEGLADSPALFFEVGDVAL